MATINDVAKMAGVSAATVSHVVNKTRYVSPELVKRVEDAIEALEFPPNFVIKKNKAAALTTSHKFVVLLASNIHNSFQLEVEKKIEQELKQKGISLISVDYGKDGAKLEIYQQLLLSSPGALGVIVFPDADEAVLTKQLGKLKIPTVLVGKEVEGLAADVIASDNFGGAYKATTHLIRSGHENIALICGNRNSESNIERINGYRSALEKNNISFDPRYVVSDLTTDEQIFSALKTLLLGSNPPTAIFAANYKTIIAIFRFIDANNISCPKDLSIVGFNDFEWAALLEPHITTVAQDTDRIGEHVVEELLKHILPSDGGTSGPSTDKHAHIVIPTELRVRASTIGIGRGPFGEKAASLDQLQLTDGEKKQIREGKYTAAISFHYTGKAWMSLHEQGIKDIFNALGISLLAVTDAHFDPVMQSKQLNSLLSLEPDILISIPTDSVKTSAAFKKIAASKTKLVLITNVPNGLTPKDYVSCVSVNERSHGRQAGRGLGEYMRKHNLKNVGLIKHGAPSYYSTLQRDNAAEQILMEEYPELKIVGSISFENEENAYTKTLELMKRHPEIEGLYISWEGPAMHVMNALNDLNRSDVAVVTADLEYAMALNMAKGGMVKALSAQLPYEQGMAMALAAAGSLIGKKVPPFVGIEPVYVTPENLLRAWGTVFKEDPSHQLLNALEENPNHVSARH